MDTPPNPNLLADRRWLIGIGITLAFGIFGGVMAVLSYTNGSRSPAQVGSPPATAAPTPQPTPTPKNHGKGHGH